MLVPFLDADGDPTAQTTPDTEISEDNAAATDSTEEVSATSNMDGMGLITFTGAETDCFTLGVNFKSASGPKATLATLYPRVLASVGTGTLSAGSAGGGTLGTLLAYDVTGCFIKTTGGTGGGGTGGASNQARKIATYDVSTGAFTVVPDWETTPDGTTTYDVLLPEGVTLGMLRTLNPTTAGRTLDVSTGGEAGLDWANIGSPTTAQNLSGTNIDPDQVVASVSGSVASVTNDVGITQAGADKVWSSAARTLTSFGTLVSDISNAVWGFATRILTAGTNIVLAKGTGVTGFNDPTVAEIADGVWDEATAGHATVGTTGKALIDAGSAGDPWSTELPDAYDPGTAGYILGTNLDGKVSEIISGPSQTIVIGTGDCASVQFFDIGEIKPVGARLESTGGTITLSAVTVTLEDADGVAMYGIEDLDATDFTTGAVTSASAYYKLDTVAPPEDGPIAAGAYRMVFTFVGTTSDTVVRTYEVPITIKVS